MTDDAARHISCEGLAALEAELRELETEGRRAIAERIRTARECATAPWCRARLGIPVELAPA
jgi:NAD(P)H-nitrite reductase large subunit